MKKDWMVCYASKGLEVNAVVKANSFNAVSDYRMKTNIQSLKPNKTIDLLKPIEYDLSGGIHDMGFIAHEVQEIFPFLVNGEKDGESYQTLNYSGLIAILAKEIQDLKKRVADLEDKM